MKYTVFIDGSEGTTGLQLQDRLAGRADIRLLHIEEALHRDIERRRELIAQADVVFLCLPDQAAQEAVALCDDPHTIIIDASTAHRVAPGWTYGLPELSRSQRDAVACTKRIANPGCYATGAICILHPLVSSDLLPADHPVTINAVSGYSGGGKKMIAAYEEAPLNEYIYPRTYDLSLNHKHLPEIRQYGGLDHTPIFTPQVGNFYAGMAVSVPLYPALLPGHPGPADILAALQKHYAGEHFIRVCPAPESGFINAGENTGSNRLTIYVCGNDEQVVITSVLDNLGKGASGAAMQNMNIALGLNETSGLE